MFGLFFLEFVNSEFCKTEAIWELLSVKFEFIVPIEQTANVFPCLNMCRDLGGYGLGYRNMIEATKRLIN